ncbi:hypothetical protein [Subtercola boreus]|nr:hypothetical protein [Subtercola boreus]
MPLGAFQLQPAEYALLRRASDDLVQQCVARAGFPLVFPARSSTEELSVTHFSFGVWTEGRAAAYGYGLVPRTAGETAFETDLAGGDRARLAAVQDCNAQPEASELNDGRESNGVASNADSESWLQMESDPRSVTIIEAHRSCMAGHDVQVADDWSVEGFESMTVEQRIATALLDVGCKRESNFVQGLADIAAAYQQHFIERHATELNEERTQLASLLARAEQIVGELG